MAKDAPSRNFFERRRDPSEVLVWAEVSRRRAPGIANTLCFIANNSHLCSNFVASQGATTP